MRLESDPTTGFNSLEVFPGVREDGSPTLSRLEFKTWELGDATSPFGEACCWGHRGEVTVEEMRQGIFSC